VVEASVRAREHLAVFSVATYIELHCSEPVDRGAVTSSSESQKFLSLFICQVLMDNLPKPLSLLTFSCITFNKAAILFPSLEIEVTGTTDKLL
jgi:hypothetical protein